MLFKVTIEYYFQGPCFEISETRRMFESRILHVPYLIQELIACKVRRLFQLIRQFRTKFALCRMFDLASRIFHRCSTAALYVELFAC